MSRLVHYDIVLFAVACVTLIVACCAQAADGETPAQDAPEQILFRKPLVEGRELVCVRSPQLPQELMRDLWGPEVAHRLKGIYELRVQIRAADRPLPLTLMTTIFPVSDPSRPLIAPRQGTPIRLPSVSDALAVLDVAISPLVENATAIDPAEVVVVVRRGGGFKVGRVLVPAGPQPEVIWTQPTGWTAFSSRVSEDPSSVRISRANGRWRMEVTSGSASRVQHTVLEQDGGGAWSFAITKQWEE